MKTCGNCHKKKDESEFYSNLTKKGGLQSYCKACNKEFVRIRYLKNKNYYKEKNKETRLRNRKYVFEYLRRHSCVDCKESDPVVLDFDHVNGEKTSTISRMVTKAMCLKTISNEIKKCKVRCANCHRRKTAREFGWLKFSGVG